MKRERSVRNSKGQSMVEYAIGIGAVAALCMVALGSLGHICGHMLMEVEHAINYNGTKSSHPHSTVNPNATPWVLD